MSSIRRACCTAVAIGRHPGFADVAIAAGNSRALIVTPRAPLGAGAFRVSLSSELGNVLADAYGNALPGAGAHGARSIAAFTVAAPP